MRRAASLLLLLGLAACQSAEQNRPERPLVALIPGKTTRTDVIQALGTPQVVRRRGDRTVYTYQFRRAEGSGVGIGNILISFMINNTLAAQDNLDVVIGPDNKVQLVRRGGYPSVDGPGPWPFGD